jgi:hypothetical protein
MIEAILITLVLLQIKHWYIDFVNQDMDEVNSKGKYGEWLGIRHSLKQGAGTALCVLIVVGMPYVGWAILMGLFDFIIHYHVDWTKMNYGNRDIQNPKFWNHLGLDQMAHQLTYLFIAFAMV